ncbi:MAG: DUF5658 family protein [Deltaproteobacteria bacterium]|nr:DUF5658 family protein [Deltaproteobacteria bacterium]
MADKKNTFTLSLPTENFAKIEVWTLAVVLVLLQILDGFLTFWGVSTFGLQMEGNPLLKFLMTHWGISFTLFVVKAVAIVAIVLLYFVDLKNDFVKNGMWSLTFFYLLCAVMPWSLLLFAWSTLDLFLLLV